EAPVIMAFLIHPAAFLASAVTDQFHRHAPFVIRTGFRRRTRDHRPRIARSGLDLFRLHGEREIFLALLRLAQPRGPILSAGNVEFSSIVRSQGPCWCCEIQRPLFVLSYSVTDRSP